MEAVANPASLVIALLAPMPERLVQALEHAGHRVARQPDASWAQATVAITRGSLPPDANDAVEYRGELPSNHAPTVGELLDASLAL